MTISFLAGIDEGENIDAMSRSRFPVGPMRAVAPADFGTHDRENANGAPHAWDEPAAST